jgi:hypothetical protein
MRRVGRRLGLSLGDDVEEGVRRNQRLGCLFIVCSLLTSLDGDFEEVKLTIYILPILVASLRRRSTIALFQNSAFQLR